MWSHQELAESVSASFTKYSTCWLEAARAPAERQQLEAAIDMNTDEDRCDGKRSKEDGGFLHWGSEENDGKRLKH